MVSGCCESQLPKNSHKHISQKAAREKKQERNRPCAAEEEEEEDSRENQCNYKDDIFCNGCRGSARVETEKAKEAGEAKQFKNVHRHCRENFNTRRVAVWSRQQGAEEFWQPQSRVQICLTSTLHSLRKSICQ